MPKAGKKIHAPVPSEKPSDIEQYQRTLSKSLKSPVEKNPLILDALVFGFEKHLGIFRKSGEPYFNHPVAVAEILIRDFNVKDDQLIAAALLHDVVEDVKSVSLLDIESRFGKPVAEVVDGCTKLSFKRFDRATQSDLTHSKIFVSASRRLGVLLIKLADRLHNMRTLGSLPMSKRRRISLETLKVYAPLAAKLNLFPIKRHLYNLALTQLFPRKSKKILGAIRELRNSEEIKEIKKLLETAFSSLSCPVTVRSRVKGLGPYYSQLRQTLALTNAENRADFTIVLDTEDLLNCYMGLGIINGRFTPVPKSIRDYIANQKPNGYQSLHVRINNKGNDYLIKIRTKKIDLRANSGMVYQLDTKDAHQDSYLEELSDLLRNIGEYAGAAPQRKDLIRLSSGEEVFLFTPKGDIHYLPRGSIVLDFAYKIHSALGDYCGGAYVNGKRVGLIHPLADGDVVKIISSYEPVEVDSDLEYLCITPKARSSVNKLLQKRRQAYAKKIGKETLLQEIERHGFPPNSIEDETISLILNFLHIKDLSQLYIRIGQDLLSSSVILYYLEDLLNPPAPHQGDAKTAPSDHTQNILYVSDFDKAVHKFSKCCNPYPGQENVLAALSERGVAFHRATCPNLQNSRYLNVQKMLNVEWSMNEKWPFPVAFDLRIEHASIPDVIKSVTPIVDQLRIQKLSIKQKKRLEAPAVLISSFFNSYQEARVFFECFEPGTVAIDSYGRIKVSP